MYVIGATAGGMARVCGRLAVLPRIVSILRCRAAAAAGGAKTATAGDEEAYDSDEYDEAVLEKKEVGDHADGEDWGEFEEEDDDWGTTGAAALKAKKYARRAAAAEGRIFTMQVRAVLCCAVLCSCASWGGGIWSVEVGASRRCSGTQACDGVVSSAVQRQGRGGALGWHRVRCNTRRCVVVCLGTVMGMCCRKRGTSWTSSTR